MRLTLKRFHFYLRKTSNLRQTIKRKLNHLLKIYILKDINAQALNRWKRDNKEILRYQYDLSSSSVVVDIGGYQGDFAAQIYAKYNCEVYLYEPIKEFYETCKERFYGNLKVNCFNYALTDKVINQFIFKDKDNSSLVIGIQNSQSEQIKSEKFSSEYRRRDFKKIDLLKINIEGGELTLIPHIIQSGLINRIRFLQIQFHNYTATSIYQREQIRAELQITHTIQWDFPFVWESWELKNDCELL